jgi:high-affinity nickel-transport protein
MIAESVAASAMLAFALGTRHGLDADHLAAIDGLTRWNSSARRLASLCGVLFSAGHIGVIVAIAGVLVVMSSHLTPPTWLEAAGTLTSGATLVLLGLLNLRAALNDGHAAAPVGLRSQFLGPLLRASRPWQIALVGALFALSFDSVAIAAFFVSSRTALGDVLLAASCFAAGMLVVGAADGWWVVRLIRQSHRNRHTPGERARADAAGISGIQ